MRACWDTGVMAATTPRSPLTHVMLSSTPGSSNPWAEKTGRTYDIRVADYGDNRSYNVTVNIDRVQRGSVGWICHRDGGLGAVAGLIVFNGKKGHEDGLVYKYGTIWPLPREYWVDGGRLITRGWDGAPFCKGPSRFQNGREARPANIAILQRELHPAVKDWLRYQLGRLETLH